MITPDFICSYWIVAWVFIYYIFQKRLGDDYALWIGLLSSLLIVFMIIKDPVFSYVYLAIPFSIKLFLIYLTSNTKYTPKKALVFLAIFILYNVYLTIRQTNIFHVFSKKRA